MDRITGSAPSLSLSLANANSSQVSDVFPQDGWRIDVHLMAAPPRNFHVDVNVHHRSIRAAPFVNTPDIG